MLMVSELIAVARGGKSDQELKQKTPLRFNPSSRKAPVVVWNINRDCNMVCPHCYAAARPGIENGGLDTAEGLRLLEDLAGYGVKVVIFSGGEPLLRPDLMELLAHAAKLGMMPNLSTNGTLIDEATAQALAEAGTVYVGISLDGPPEFNDPYRGLEKGFEKAVNGLRLARAAGMRTGVRITLTRRNTHHMESVLETAREVGAHRFYVSHLVYAGRGYKMIGDDLDAGETRTQLSRLFELADGMLDDPEAPRVVTGSNDSGGPLLLRWLQERFGMEAAAPVQELLALRGGNSSGEGMVAIDTRGRVHPDQFWQKAVLGDVRSQSFAEIMEHPLCGQLKNRERLLKGRCAECTYVPLCRGSHRERAEARYNDIWAPDPGCVMLDEEIREKMVAEA